MKAGRKTSDETRVSNLAARQRLPGSCIVSSRDRPSVSKVLPVSPDDRRARWETKRRIFADLAVMRSRRDYDIGTKSERRTNSVRARPSEMPVAMFDPLRTASIPPGSSWRLYLNVNFVKQRPEFRVSAISSTINRESRQSRVGLGPERT